MDCFDYRSNSRINLWDVIANSWFCEKGKRVFRLGSLLACRKTNGNFDFLFWFCGFHVYALIFVALETPFSLCVGEFFGALFILQLCVLVWMYGQFWWAKTRDFCSNSDVVFVRREKKFSSILAFSTTENFLSWGFALCIAPLVFSMAMAGFLQDFK